MRRLGFSWGSASYAAIAVGLMTILGCPSRKADRDTPPDPSPVGNTGAKNEAQITRYPNETSLGGAPALIANNGTVARTFPGAGQQVAVLSKSQPCGKISQYGNAGTLIIWNDPTGSMLMGWVPNGSFQGSVNPSTIKPVVVVKDAGAQPPAPDPAPGPAPGPAPAPADAGPPSFGPCPVSCPAVNNQCPTGKKNENGMCRIPCTKNDQCPRGVTCNVGRGVCTSG